MKILYVAICDLWGVGASGIRKKICAQTKSLEKKCTTLLATQKNDLLCVYQKNHLLDKKAFFTQKEIYEYLMEFAIKEEITHIYWRYLRADSYLYELFKKLKQYNIQIILEFPTFPYDKHWEGTIELEQDLMYRNKLSKYVSMSVNYNQVESIFGIKSIPLINAIDIDSVPIKKETIQEDIHFLAVSSLNYWHGYDRMIEGMAQYYQNGYTKKVYLKLIGNGNESEKYRAMIEKYDLLPYIQLEGYKEGIELTEAFDWANIGIGVLGMFRWGTNSGSSIKATEYCARGIPFITGYHELAFQEELPFVYSVPNNETPINIQEVLQFYATYKKVSNKEELRRFAEQNLTWDCMFEQVFDEMH